MPPTRPYSLEIKDVKTGKTMLFTVVDLSKAELKAVIAQSMRLASLPDGADLTAPANDEETGEGS